jgi:hypothetical protein
MEILDDLVELLLTTTEMSSILEQEMSPFNSIENLNERRNTAVLLLLEIETGDFFLCADNQHTRSREAVAHAEGEPLAVELVD